MKARSQIANSAYIIMLENNYKDLVGSHSNPFFNLTIEFLSNEVLDMLNFT